jgi:hypothetical protein
MKAALERDIRRRARGCCEYCRFPQAHHFKKFHIDHVIAEQHGGPTVAENLALCCSHCNFHKGPNLSGVDPITKQIVQLFNPRQDRWSDHFDFNAATIVGLTPAGRATVGVLNMNAAVRVRLRTELINMRVFPPTDAFEEP